MRGAPQLDRRLLLGLTVAATVTGARAQQVPGLLIGGPPGGRLDGWATPLSAAVGRGLAAHAPLLPQHSGGLDGVTAANAFGARGEPDGSVALLVPGAAALSWLAGETRAKFDLGRWLPLWAANTPCLLLSRVQLQPGRTLKVAGTGPVGPELPFLLALGQFGITPVLTAASEAEAMVAQGAGLAAAVESAAADGFYPVLTAGVASGGGTLARDPLWPTVPTALELAGPGLPPPFAAAIVASSMAAQLDAALVLLQLTPAATVAGWRTACQPILQDPDLAAAARGLGSRMLPVGDALDCIGRIEGDPAMLLTLRQRLAQLGWRPD